MVLTWFRVISCGLAFGVGVASGVCGAAPAEVRGTWLTTTGVDHIRTGNNTAEVLSDLREIGLNTVYVETWKNGYTNYPSTVLASFTGGPDRSTFLGSTRDLVEETLIHSHRQGLNYIGWFEYGLSAQFVGTGGNPNNPLAARMKSEGWLLQDQSGQYGNASNGFAWMNPAVPEVRQFVIDLTLEAVNRYDFDGIQFDDRLAWPKEFGWDATTAALYASETGRSLPSNVNDTHFRSWRQGKVTQFAEELTAAVRTHRPNLHLSISPSITNFSEAQYNADWPDWQDEELFDEYVIQVYRDNISSFNSTIGGQVSQFPGGELNELVVGLRGGTASAGSETPYADLEAMIERTRAEGAAGHSIFFSKSVRDVYGQQLTEFYDVENQGPAVNPLFAADWRSMPIVGAPEGTTNTWQFEVQQGNRYRVVAKVGAYWQELSSMPLASGTQELVVPGASAVELLVDRRPLASPDFNGDGFVNLADYVVWRDNLGSTVDLRADFDNDQLVGPTDYLAWKRYFGMPSANSQSGVGSAQVPEPMSLVAVICFVIMVSGTKRCLTPKPCVAS
ncbi:glycoside hydrolase family 10 protein [Aeoliella sp. SH292]|uniref:glycoside hydrolase family 10 protein n=1 Tax=Aeoliella sp. SH292 TaxID=3454464 RepID=UPI003F9A01C2